MSQWSVRLLLLLLLSALSITNANAEPVNILLFTADDLHAESVGVFQEKPTGLTPNLDQFAAEGMQFDRAHVNVAICAPCRAVIATGLLSHRSGAMGFVKAKPGTPEIVTTFQQAGFLAGILGKVDHSTPVTTTRWDYSFDQKELGNGRNPEIYYQRCRTFFERCREEEKPFYFMVNSHDPHRPYCDPDMLTKGAAMPSKVYSPKDVIVPGFVPDLPGVREELAEYLNSTRRLDDTFGKVMLALKESGYAENTLVMFLSDNGIAIPFAKCNAWFHSSRTPLLARWPSVIQPGSVDRTHFISVVDLFPTFLEATGVKGPQELDGRSFVPLLKGETQANRDIMFTQIDMKAGGAAVPMRCVQTEKFAYIYNPFSDGTYWYRNNNEGKTMAAMNQAAKVDPAIAARIDLFRHRVPEEFYNLQTDPDCLYNLIDDPSHTAAINSLQTQLQSWMTNTADPILKAYQHREDRSVVDQVLEETYSPWVVKKDKSPKSKGRNDRRRSEPSE